MAELIERETLRRYFEQNPETDFSAAEIVNTIDYMPSIDAAPVVHAKWFRWWEKSAMYSCSNCERGALLNGDGSELLTPFCPHCGARMDADAPERGE